MERKRREEEDMQESLLVEEGMMVKFPLIPFVTCLLPLQLLLQASFRQEKVAQPHCIDTQRPPEAQDHLPDQCNHCGKNFLRKSSLNKRMLMVHGASRPSKMLANLYAEHWWPKFSIETVDFRAIGLVN